MRNIREALALSLGALFMVALGRPATAGGNPPEYEPPERPRCDLNSQGGMDVVARYTDLTLANHKNRHIIWIFQSSFGQPAPAELASRPPRVIAIGDFVLGGPCDLLWESHNSDHTVTLLAVTQGFIQAEDEDFAGGLVRPGSAWEVAGSSDLTGDGRSDVLWWNRETGALDLWVTSPTGGWSKASVLTGPNSPSWPHPPVPPKWWRALATPRLDQRRQAGILWDNPATLAGLQYTPTVWTGTELIIEPGEDLPIDGGPEWTVVAVGDFDNDGHEDLLRQRRHESRLQVCYMEGTILRGADCESTIPDILAGPGGGNSQIVWSVVGPR
jgi:hypothetical protein